LETVKFLIDFVLHIDKHLGELMIQHGPWWMYGIIFLIIFIETGLVFMPFLPGDSLLFASGALWAATGNNIFALLLLCIAAAVIGDNCNYFIGRNFSEYLKSKPWFKKLVSDENIQLPNFSGWSKAEVLSYKQLSGLDIEVEGNGYVQSQSIPAGRSVKKGESIKIKFS